ncbi:hypothetical protein HID58_003394 [Brassica napus]|uniref:Uncharacterized protein n=1 Tax=Brassica napus TaxID=3708 RepID=A0ABQ8CWB4_BRANA|nr:hypothetical protein HID58_021115 [Brassica napus]KAH0943751.1 hypothetical protein HID58_003388 [Brassica napus]KAH0943757.1 hypothetical protein HID58_003394 [Brassica napus]
MTRLQQIPMVSFLLSSSAPTTQTAQLNHGVHLSLKNPSVARGNSLGLMSPDPPEPPDPPDLGSVMVESNLVTVSFEYDLSSSMVEDSKEMVDWIIFCSAWTYGLV